jgi:aryl-alcohol dehydrogenase-like predicted oxidoreductase
MQEHGCTASPRVPAIGDARVPRRDVNCRPGADRRLRSPDLADDDWRKTSPRFTKGNFEQNLRIIDEVQGVASELDATAAQVALAWLLAQGDDIAPIPGTKRVSRVEDNTAADGVTLSAGQIQRLNNLTPAAGERHDETNMSAIDV